MPASCKPGDAAPSIRPKHGGGGGDGEAAAVDAAGNSINANETVDSLFASKLKLSKEEKAAARKAKAKAKKAAKGEDGDGEEEEEETELVVAPKAELKKARKRAADKRKAGGDTAECTTDDELEAAGFLAQ